jgi:hypothetical protein
MQYDPAELDFESSSPVEVSIADLIEALQTFEDHNGPGTPDNGIAVSAARLYIRKNHVVAASLSERSRNDSYMSDTDDAYALQVNIVCPISDYAPIGPIIDHAIAEVAKSDEEKRLKRRAALEAERARIDKELGLL